MAQGRKAEAEALMEKLADGNGTRMPLEPLAEPLPVAPDAHASNLGPGAEGQPLTLFGVLKHRNSGCLCTPRGARPALSRAACQA